MMNRRCKILFLVLSVAAVVFAAVDLMVGAVVIPVGDVWAALRGAEVDRAVGHIVLNFRLPKCVMAVIVGMALPTVGLQMQTMFRNPLAGPYVLGVSSGASLGVALFLLGVPLVGAASGSWLRDLGVVGAAWIGSAAIMLVVMAVTARIKDVMAVLILGMMFGSAASAVVEILQYVSSEGAVKSFVVWTMGSLGGVTAERLWLVGAVSLTGMIMSIALIKPLNMLLLGDNYARTMGLNVRAVRLTVTLTTVLLAGTVTAFCGPIGFVGLAVPHIARMLFRQADLRILMPATMLTGVVVMLFCDIVSQVVSREMVLPINTVTALVGIPVVVAVIVRSKGRIM